MAKQFLDRPNVITILKQVCSKGMAEDVTACGLGKAGFENRLLDPSRYRGRCASPGKNGDSFGWLGGGYRCRRLKADSVGVT